MGVPVKKIKGAAHKCFSDGDGVVWCERAFRHHPQTVRYISCIKNKLFVQKEAAMYNVILPATQKAKVIRIVSAMS